MKSLPQRFENENTYINEMYLIHGFGRASPGFGSDPPIGSGWAQGLLHYDTSEDEVLVAYAPNLKENSSIKSQNTESSNLRDNLVQTSLESLVPNIEIEADLSEDSPVEKHDSQGINPDDIVVRTTSETSLGIGKEDQLIPIQWEGWVRRDFAVNVFLSKRDITRLVCRHRLHTLLLGE